MMSYPPLVSNIQPLHNVSEVVANRFYSWKKEARFKAVSVVLHIVSHFASWYWLLLDDWRMQKILGIHKVTRCVLPLLIQLWANYQSHLLTRPCSFFFLLADAFKVYSAERLHVSLKNLSVARWRNGNLIIHRNTWPNTSSTSW